MEETTGTPEVESGSGTHRGFQRGIGKLLLVAAGAGAVALVIFGVLPMLTASAPEPVPMAPEEIVSEVLREPLEGEAAALREELAPEDVPAVPTPLVAVRENGDEVPVVFTAGEEPGAGKDAAAEGDLEAALPPVLSAEEIEAAVGVPVSDEAATEEAGTTPTVVAQASTATAPSGAPAPEALGNAERTAVGPLQERHQREMTRPPAKATREVQGLLESLGFEPGPMDGVWGDRTERAWKRFAREARDLEDRAQLARALPMARQTADAPPELEDPAAPPGGTGTKAAHGAAQAGAPRAGLLPQTTFPEDERMRVPGTLRGVMGYRLPLVSRQEVPDQVVSGVLIPAHTTFVILRGGEWELTGLHPHEVERLEGAARAKATPAPAIERQPRRRGWNPLRLFRRQPRPADRK